MVDFQERDTRRSTGDDEDGGDDAREEGRNGDEAGHDGGGAGHGGREAGHDERESGHGDHEAERDAHEHHSGDLDAVAAAVLTVSTSRTIAEDGAGDAIVEILEGKGHEIVTRELVNDDYDGVQSAVDALVSRSDVDAVLTTGGTGVAPEDVTPEAVRPLFEKELPGFGERFRARSHEEIGTKAIGSRAVAGIADGVPVFCLPGSEAAVRLGTAEIVEPAVCHLAGLSRPHDVEE